MPTNRIVLTREAVNAVPYIPARFFFDQAAYIRYTDDLRDSQDLI